MGFLTPLWLGLAAFWVFYVVAYKPPPPLRPVTRWVRRHPAARSFVLCPWCFPVWVVVVLALVTQPWTLQLLYVIPAAAAIAAVTALFVPDDGEPDEA